jgi:hypothetical protein
MKCARVLHSLILAASLAGVAWCQAAADSVPSPTVVGPIRENAPPGDPSRDYIFFTPVEILGDYGCVDEDYFIEGTAHRYDTPEGETGTSVS